MSDGHTPPEHPSPELLIIGAGPAGSAAAVYAARAGMSCVLVDSAPFPRDKTCGDGLTPRAISQLKSLGLADTLLQNHHNKGLQLHGFGASVEVAWPKSRFGTVGSAMARKDFDYLLFQQAVSFENVTALTGKTVIDIDRNSHINRDMEQRINSVTLDDGQVIRPKNVIVADGVRSSVGKQLGRTWHRNEVYGIAARAYCATPRSKDPWIHSDLELRDQGQLQPGYGWIFPLGNGYANVGCGALSTSKRPAKLNTKKVLAHYAESKHEWEFSTPTHVASALLPMGGAVSNVAGPNWMLIGDAAACVNPLNGEGIDYALETAALAISLLQESSDYQADWPALLRQEYGHSFLLARTAARLLTYPQLLQGAGKIAFHDTLAPRLMPAVVRLMGNLVTEEDKDLVAKTWFLAAKGLGWGSARLHSVTAGSSFLPTVSERILWSSTQSP